MLDSQNEFLKVDSSIFGLWVKTPDRNLPRPFVRVEYDRRKRRASAAHIQIHAESKDLKWIDQSAGRTPRQTSGSDQLYLGHLGVVAAPGAQLDDAGVTARAAVVAGRHLVE